MKEHTDLNDPTPLKAIGLFNDSYPPLMDGVAVTVYNYAYWMHRKGENVKVFTPKVPKAEDKDDFEVFRYTSLPLRNRKPYRLGFPYADFNILNKIFLKKSFKIVHAHSPFSAGHLAMFAAASQKVPMVATFHSKFRDDFERITKSRDVANAMLKTIMPIFDYADEVWIPQAAVEETIREYGFKGKVEVVNNGTDLVAEGPIEAVKKAAKKWLKVSEEVPVFLFVGQHIWQKNTAMIIEALDLLRDLPYRMYFVGTGYASEGMQRMVKERKLENKILFTGNIGERELLKTYYAAADLFLFPSIYDNAPLVVREAAAMHTPAVIIAGSTTSEIISDGENGFLTENNAISMARKIRQLMRDIALIRMVGYHASKSIAFSWEHIVEEVLDRYNCIIARKC